MATLSSKDVVRVRAARPYVSLIFAKLDSYWRRMGSKKYRERADLDALLRRLGELESFRPDSIVHTDKPDFIITAQDRVIGVETTRSEPEEYFRALHIQATKFPERWVNTTHFKSRQTRRTNQELERSMGVNALLQPGRSPETGMLEWVERIQAALNSKRLKFNQADYRKSEENWLLIHEHFALPNDEFTRQRAEQLLTNLFLTPTPVARDFDAVFVHSGDLLFRWQNGALELADSAFQRGHS